MKIIFDFIDTYYVDLSDWWFYILDILCIPLMFKYNDYVNALHDIKKNTVDPEEVYYIYTCYYKWSWRFLLYITFLVITFCVMVHENVRIV